jgi:hypothetical protein
MDCLSMGWLVFQNESLVSSLLATTGMAQAGLLGTRLAGGSGGTARLMSGP